MKSLQGKCVNIDFTPRELQINFTGSDWPNKVRDFMVRDWKICVRSSRVAGVTLDFRYIERYGCSSDDLQAPKLKRYSHRLLVHRIIKLHLLRCG